MERVLGFLKSYWKPVTAGLLAVMLLAIALIATGAPSLDKFKALADKGEIDACRAELLKALKGRPNWHEGREFLTELELRHGNYSAATVHLVVLARAGRDTGNWEDSLVSLRTIAPLTELEMAIDPEWHWPRLFYIRLALANGQHNLALSQIIQLAELGEDVSQLTAQVEQSIFPATDITLLVSLLDYDQLWMRELALKLALRSNNPAVIIDAVQKLYSLSPSNGLLDQSLQSLLSNNQFSAAWVVAQTLGQGEDAIIHSLYQASRENLPSMLDQLKDIIHPELEMLRAMAKDSPLPGMLILEQDGFAPRFPDLYARQKLTILTLEDRDYSTSMVNHISPEQVRSFLSTGVHRPYSACLNILEAMAGKATDNLLDIRAMQAEIIKDAPYLPPVIFSHTLLERISQDKLLELALRWSGLDEYEDLPDKASRNIADYLKTQPEPGPRFASYITASLQRAKSVREPDILISPPGNEGVWYTSVSPNGRFVIFSYGSMWSSEEHEHYLLDVANNTQKRLPRAMYDIHWSPDSTLFAARMPDKFEVYNSVSGAPITEYVTGENGGVMGWLDNSTILWGKPIGQEFQVYTFNIATKQNTTHSKHNNHPRLTPLGKLASVSFSEAEIKVTWDGQVRTYPNSCNAISLTGWMPGDKGLVLWSHETQQNHFLIFSTEEFKQFDIPNLRLEDVWIDDTRVFASGWDTPGTEYYFFIYDIENLTLEPTGFYVSEWSGLLGKRHYSNFSRIWLHK